MHKFLRSIGFSTYRKKRDIEKLLASLIPSAKWHRIQLDEETNLCELRAEVAPGMGIVMMGEMDEEGAFQCEYYYPYLNSSDVSSTTDCSIQRHTEKETYAGLLDEYRVGISLIFYLGNCYEYRERKAKRMPRTAESVNLTGIVLNASPVGDNDRRLVILTRERGKITAFARGAKRPGSQLMGVTRPFVFGTFKLYEGRDAYNLQGADVLNYFAEIPLDMEAACYGSYFLEFADYYGRENLEATEQLLLLYQSLRALLKPALPDPLVQAVFELRSMVIN